jgi:nitroimidazol reductase NimA-like FMN-containing flavoprotein (pyridoxamine 5'-phosphate oxidase superfamily)
MRRKDREMPRDFAEAAADKCLYAVLSTVDSRGGPYGVPLSIAREGEWIYFHCAGEGRKIENLKACSKVCLTCVGNAEEPPDDFTVYYESAIIFGSAREVLEDTEKIRALRLVCERHTPANMAAFDAAIDKGLAVTSVWKIHIEEITGKGHLRA